MKKLLSLILAFAMIFSLAAPAMAAETTDDKKQEVTASYTPSPATITGVSIEVDGKTYTNGTVTITPETESVIYTVSGTCFAGLSENNGLTYA